MSISRSGIFKKHLGQIYALKDLGNTVYGIFMQKDLTVFVEFHKSKKYKILESYQVNQIHEKKRFWSISSKIISENSFDFVYVRYDYSYQDQYFLCFIIDATRKNKLILEFPTFPYDEIVPTQYIEIENLRRRKIVNLVDQIVTPSRVNTIDNKSTIVFDNGYYSDIKNINLTNSLVLNDAISLVMTANFDEWHGAERILYSLKSHLSKFPENKIMLVFIGEGPEITRLKKIAGELHIVDNVDFKEFVHVDSLPLYYGRMSCGLCTLGEYKANRQDSSTLKSKEYLMHGLPVVYAVDDPVLDNSPYSLKVANNASIPDMGQICNFVRKMHSENNVRKQIHEFFKMAISWKPFAQKLIHRIS